MEALLFPGPRRPGKRSASIGIIYNLNKMNHLVVNDSNERSPYLHSRCIAFVVVLLQPYGL